MIPGGSWHWYGFSNQLISALPLTTTLPIGTTVQIGAASGAATLDLNGINQQVAALSDNGTYTNGRIINSASSSPVTLTLSPSGSTTFSGSILGGGTLGAISLQMS